jgi:hypothetical protein
MLSKGIMGKKCGAHRAPVHRTPSTKKQRTARAPPTGSEPLELNRAFVIFAKIRMDQSAKMTAATMLLADIGVACARHTIFAIASENIRERPQFAVAV